MNWWTWVKYVFGAVQLFLCVVCGQKDYLATAEAHTRGWRVRGSKGKIGDPGVPHVCNRCGGL